MRATRISLPSFFYRPRRWFAVLGLVALSSCAPSTVSERPAGARDILVVTGEGFVPVYRGDPRAENLWKTVAERYAHALAAEFRTAGHRARVYINPEKGKGAREVVPQLLAGHTHDALVQVRIRHVKNSTENTVYLIPTWLTLRYERRPDGGRTAITENEIERAESMLRTDGRKDRRSDSFPVMAREFIDDLRRRGAM